MKKYKKYYWYVPLKDMKNQDNKPKYLIIHHSAANNSFAEVQRYHIEDRKFENIGYHFYILKDGTVHQGRPQHYHGAHTRGYNKKSLGICFQGNYSKEKRVPKAQKEALIKLMKALRETYNIPLTNIKPHRAVADTECYGTNLTDNWARDLLVESTTSLDEFSTFDLLKTAFGRPDFYKAVVKLFS